MADQSEETIEEEEMARQSQEPEQTSRAVVENIQPLPETRAENTQMLQGSSLTAAGDRVLHSATLIQQLTSSGSGNFVIISPQNFQINAPKRPAATGSEEECPSPKIPKLADSSQAAGNGRSLQPQTPGSEEECPSPKIPKLDDSSQAAASGRSIQPQTPDDGRVQGAHPTNYPAQVAAKSCRLALRTHYRTTGSYVQLIPWEDDDTKHIKDIFTELTLEKSGEKLESYKDIFLQTTRDGHSIKRIILNGLAGRGKSTIMDKMAYDWACGEALQQFELVFVLRMSAVEQSENLIDSIFEQLLDEDTDVEKTLLSSFISHNQDKVLILFDGFDELRTPALDKALFGSILKILNRKKGRDYYVVVTTRSSHLDQLVRKSLIREPYTQVRVEGFDKEDIKKYVRRFYSEDHDKAEGLLQRIKCSIVLTDLAKGPMLLLLMCVLWRDNSTLPETMSRIYSEALEYIFHRKTDLSLAETSKVTQELGKTGLHGLLAFPEKVFGPTIGSNNCAALKQQLDFPEERFEPSVLESAIKAGILTRQRVMKGMRSHNSIQFLNKTFQEFCAGKYLQSLLETDPVEFKKNLQRMINSEGNDFEYVFRFCAGDKMESTSSILQTLAESDQLKEENKFRDTTLMQLGLNCYFEGQSKDLPPVQFIESVLTDELDINDWNRDRLNSFTYFLRNVHTHTLENKQTDYLDKVKSIKIQRCHLGKSMSDLAYCLSLMVSLSSVTMQKCRLYDSSEEYVALSGATSVGLAASSWAHHFKKFINLEKLTLSCCSLTGEDMTHIAPALAGLPKLVKLDLGDNETLGGSAALWVHHFKKLINLKKLTLSCCSLTGEGMTHIVPALCDLPTLVKLDLGENEALGGSAASWAHHFKKMQKLQNFDSSWCSLTGEDMKHIALALADLPNLVQLNLWGNDALGSSAASWAHHFKKMKKLQKVDLSYCSLTREDMKHIAPALDLPNLVQLNLWGNALGGSASSWVHHFKMMKKLILYYW